jgi:hypothetical protein
MDDPFSGDPRPPMTHREASWHEHGASVRAGASPTAATDPARGLATAAAYSAPDGGLVVSGIRFRPLTAGGLLAIQATARLAEDAGRSLDGADEIAALVYCVAESETAFLLAEEGRLGELMAAARRLLAPVPLTELRSLSLHCQEVIARATGREAEADELARLAAEKKTAPAPLPRTA